MLSVNVNKIALIRNARGTDYPNLLHFIRHILAAGVKGITVHPRPDERHITRQDTYDIAELLTSYPDVEFNIEGFPSDAFMAMIAEVKPAQCTLVPDEPGQLTSDHGWDVEQQQALLSDVLGRLAAMGVRSSLFLDPLPSRVEAVKAVGADRIELYTESFARACAGSAENPQLLSACLRDYRETTDKARALGLGVNAGHDLNLEKLATFLEHCPVDEVSIGHALVVESLEMGMPEVLKRYLAITGG